MKAKIKILQNCRIENNVVKLPQIPLTRKTYLEVKKSLELIGGKWKGGKVSGFVFKTDPTELLEQIASGGNRNLKKEYQFFATPEKLAKKLVEMADIQTYDTVLEPSAGQGAIIEQINKVSNVVPDCYEIMEINRMILKQSNLRYNLLGNDFLKSDDKEYSLIIANPPYAKNQDIEHVYKMYDKLARGGRIVTLMSRHWQNSTYKKETKFRKFLEQTQAYVSEVKAGEFKASKTMIATVIVFIQKPVF